MVSSTSKRRLTVGALAAVLAPAALGISIAIAAPAAAAPEDTPVGCFGFDSSTGTIDAYLPFAGPDNTEPCPTDVVIPDRIDSIPVSRIGDAAFTGGVITSVEIPDTVVEVGQTAFGWLGLASVSIPDSVTSIGASAFRGNQLTQLVIPDSVTEVGEGAFAFNPLTSVTIGKGLTHLPASVFEGANLTSVHIPATVTSMDSSAFHSNPVTKLTVGDPEYKGKPALTIPASAFQTAMLTGSGVTDLYLGSNVEAVDTLAFFGAPLTGKVTIDEGLTRIGVSAFRSTQIGALTLPASVRTIDAQAFWEAGLTSVTLPTSLTTLGNAAFGVNKLTEVTFPDSIETFGDGILQQNPTLTTVRFGTAEYTGDARWTLTGYTAATFGNKGLSTVTFGPVVKAIGDGAFTGNQLTDIIIPGSVTSVGEKAFAHGAIGKVTIEDGVKAVKADAFAHNPVTDVTVAGNPALDTTAFAYNVTAGVPDTTDAAALAKFFHEHAALVRLHAADKDFAAKHDPGFVHTEKAGKDELPVYGFIVNPVTYTVLYLDGETETELRDATVSNVGDGLTGYQISLNPTGNLDRYFRAGQKIELVAPAVDGYETPKARTVTLEGGENVFTFTYGRSGAWGAEDDQQPTDDSTAEPENTDTTGTTETGKTGAEATPEPTDAGTVQTVTISAITVLAGIAVIWLLSQVRIRRNKGL